AGINMLIFEFITVRDAQAWNVEPTPPLPARLAGGISITCWALVFIFGRWTGFSVLPEREGRGRPPLAAHPPPPARPRSAPPGLLFDSISGPMCLPALPARTSLPPRWCPV